MHIPAEATDGCVASPAARSEEALARLCNPRKRRWGKAALSSRLVRASADAATLRARWLILPLTLIGLVMAGALGAPFLRDEVPFEAVERNHFDAIAVVPEKEAPTPGPLHLRVD